MKSGKLGKRACSEGRPFRRTIQTHATVRASENRVACHTASQLDQLLHQLRKDRRSYLAIEELSCVSRLGRIG
jgi:hypothetical protein